MPKRSVQEGSIYKYKTPRGHQRWRFQLWVPGALPGSLTRVGEGGFVTAEAARNALHSALSKTKKNEPVLPKSKIPVLKDFATLWLGGLISLQSATIQGYDKNLRNHILPSLGHLRLDQLTPVVLNQHFKNLGDSGRKDGKDHGGSLSTNTLDKVGTVLSLILESAVDENLIAFNPMRKVKLGSIQRAQEELKVWNIEQMKLFLEWNSEIEKDDLNPLWHLICFTGLRRGEALALRWSDLDFKNSRLMVLRATDASQARVVKDTKTKSSRRNLVIDEFTLGALKSHRNIRSQLNLQFVKPDAWVFGGLQGQLRVPNDVTARWTRAMERAVSHFGASVLPPMTLKGLRHSHATALLELNVNPKVVQERLGHSTFHVTMNTYSHVTVTMQESAITELSRRYGIA